MADRLDLGLTELPDDLLRCELLSSWHLSPSLGLHHTEILSLKVATFKGGRSLDFGIGIIAIGAALVIAGAVVPAVKRA